MNNVTEIFGSLVFNEKVMRERLPTATFNAMVKTIKYGKKLDPALANIVANAMKDWAISHGATHFTHWFQPLTSITAEKHESFITPVDDGNVIMIFSGKELVQGESDASSFPNGGLRATFEARGYTAWDPTSYAFIKEGVLCIPTAFCSYGGEALDKKTPLLRSMEAINRQIMRVLKLFGNNDITFVKTTVGAEQEYFLIDKEHYNSRPDLFYTGRTLIGAKPPKGQELEDHYFGSIKPRISAFMKDLNVELWKLGILAKIEHNEAAPSQHELAPIYTTTNIASDHNQLTMEIMQKVARAHDLICLLHEKPFEGVNGSGKHNNWSIATNTGVNLLDPGETPSENAQFLLFLSAVIKAVDEYADLLRISVTSAGNDHRLGSNEAPPAIISIFLGEELSSVLDAIKNGVAYDQKAKKEFKVGVHTLPSFPRDSTDRNRTSPFAFTGNKFEFRMLGSSASISDSNTVLNTAVAEVLSCFADKLEAAGEQNFTAILQAIVKETITNHARIIFNGNGYDDCWKREAEARGLANLPTTPDALPKIIEQKNIDLFTKHKVLTETEIRSRYDILLENYTKVVNIEAQTLLEMIKKDILPSVSAYGTELVSSVAIKSQEGYESLYESEMAKTICTLTSKLYEQNKNLELSLTKAKTISNHQKIANYFKDKILPLMKNIREICDILETQIPKEYWKYPTYGDILFAVR